MVVHGVPLDSLGRIDTLSACGSVLGQDTDVNERRPSFRAWEGAWPQHSFMGQRETLRDDFDGGCSQFS